MPAQTERPGLGYPALVVVSGALVLATIYWAFFRAPFEMVMGAAQKIFYFHVPVAYSMYLGAAACFVGSGLYLYNQSETGDAVARAGAEVAFLFGAMTEASGIIWARPIWGVYWSWEPRLLTALLSTMVYAAYVVLRNFAGDGEAERKFAAALGVLGAANLPIIHYAVQKWGGNHPAVVTGKGGGLGHPDMQIAFALGMVSFTLFTASLVWARARLHLARARIERAEERALELGLLGDEA
jgi:heme exporter protein C